MAPKRFREKVIYTGMIAALGATALTGYRIVRPMKIHPVAGSIFLGLSIVHLLVSGSKRHHHKKSRAARRAEPDLTLAS